jgi:hypothetical protein
LKQAEFIKRLPGDAPARTFGRRTEIADCPRGKVKAINRTHGSIETSVHGWPRRRLSTGF